MIQLSIDIETYSSVNLLKSGVYAYADAPDFTILLFAYAFDDEDIKIVDIACGYTLSLHDALPISKKFLTRYFPHSQMKILRKPLSMQTLKGPVLQSF